MTKDEIRQLAKAVGERSGWDFTKVRDERDPVPWDYLAVVRQYLKPTDNVLDVGTGGGKTSWRWPIALRQASALIIMRL